MNPKIKKIDSEYEKNAAKIAEVEDKLNDLKADLPLVYVTRELRC